MNIYLRKEVGLTGTSQTAMGINKPKWTKLFSFSHYTLFSSHRDSFRQWLDFKMHDRLSLEMEKPYKLTCIASSSHINFWDLGLIYAILDGIMKGLVFFRDSNCIPQKKTCTHTTGLKEGLHPQHLLIRTSGGWMRVCVKKKKKSRPLISTNCSERTDSFKFQRWPLPSPFFPTQPQGKSVFQLMRKSGWREGWGGEE